MGKRRIIAAKGSVLTPDEIREMQVPFDRVTTWIDRNIGKIGIGLVFFFVCFMLALVLVGVASGYENLGDMFRDWGWF